MRRMFLSSSAVSLSVVFLMASKAALVGAKSVAFFNPLGQIGFGNCSDKSSEICFFGSVNDGFDTPMVTLSEGSEGRMTL